MSGALKRRFNRLPHDPSVSHVVVGHPRRHAAEAFIRVTFRQAYAVDVPASAPDRMLPEQEARSLVAVGVVGQPERLCAWLNGCAPARVDVGMRGKLSTIKHHAGDRTIAAGELVQS
jgi:hypothetical protein